jgi:hypothetical protein
VLDTNLKEYIQKPVGVCGVSAGPFSGARMIQSVLPVLREPGLVTILGRFSAMQESCSILRLAKLTDSACAHRREKFLNELVWMPSALRYAREKSFRGMIAALHARLKGTCAYIVTTSAVRRVALNR